jgi:hypothetical protein
VLDDSGYAVCESVGTGFFNKDAATQHWELPMKTVKEILARHGVESVDQMDLNESYSIELPGFDTLTIEKVAPERLSVAHHRVQRGDLMCDPEIVFRVESDGWVPVEYTRHPRLYRHDESGLQLDGFVEKWNRNLREQGFLKPAASG